MHPTGPVRTLDVSEALRERCRYLCAVESVRIRQVSSTFMENLGGKFRHYNAVSKCYRNKTPPRVWRCWSQQWRQSKLMIRCNDLIFTFTSLLAFLGDCMPRMSVFPSRYVDIGAVSHVRLYSLPFYNLLFQYHQHRPCSRKVTCLYYWRHS